MGTTEISTVSNITLVTLQGSPATTGFMAEVFERAEPSTSHRYDLLHAPGITCNTGLYHFPDQDHRSAVFANTPAIETGIKVIVSSSEP